MNGISYYASNQWRAAAAKPPHLAAICVWEGWNDAYRESARHGGIICSFRKNWQDMQVKTVQHGQGERGKKNPNTGELVCGPETLDREAIAGKPRGHVERLPLARARWDDYYRERSRRSFEGRRCRCSRRRTGAGRACTRAATSKASSALLPRTNGWKCTAARTGRPSTPTTASRCRSGSSIIFLKGEKNGWDRQPRVLLNVRHPGEKFVQRHENEWPLARTQWTRFYLDPANDALTNEEPASAESITYDPMGNGVTFSMTAAARRPRSPARRRSSFSCHPRRATRTSSSCCACSSPAARRCCSRARSTRRRRSAQGWLRASHRKLDPEAARCLTGPGTRTTSCRS